MNRTLASALASLLTISAFAQSPYLVKDIYSTFNEYGGHSVPANFVADGDTVYFSAKTHLNGRELWKFSGGQAGLVKDIRIYSGDSNPSPLVPIGGGVFLFSATNGTQGIELWRTDGTDAGTSLVKDIRPSGSASVLISSAPHPSAGKIFLSADDGVHGRELWVSDGTAEGTQLAVDFNGTSASSNPTLISFGDHFLVSAAGALWTTDGTQAGTQLVKSPVVVSGGFRKLGSSLAFFVGWDADHGYEVWRTDGTDAGTLRLEDLNPGPASAFSGIFQLTTTGARLLFVARDATGVKLWGSDGSPGAATPLGGPAIPDQCDTCPFIPMRNGLGIVFFQSSGLWRSDGTVAGTFLVDEATESVPMTEAFAAFYYRTTVGDRHYLRRTDGTAAGASTVMELPAGFPSSPGAAFTGGKLYFGHSDYYYGHEPWVSEDGTAATTHRLANIVPDYAPSSSPSQLIASGDQLFFLARGDGFASEIWRSDGTEAGTRRLTSDGDSINASRLQELTPFGGALYFLDYVSVWRSDGSPEGTRRVENLYGNTLFAGSRLLYLRGSETEVGAQHPVAWRTDGTPAGTFSLAVPGAFWDSFPSSPHRFAELAGRVFFTSAWSQNGWWRTDGTPQTTKRMSTFNANEEPGLLVPAAGAIYTTRTTPQHGKELWRSDGRAPGFSLVKDIVPGDGSSDPGTLTAAGAYLYFVATDPTRGTELWRTDGTEGGTIPLKDILEGPLSSSPRELTAVAGMLFFTADDGIHGIELWRTDGTEMGTVLVRDVAPGAPPSSPSSLAAADGVLWFTANDGMNGAELWRSDGSAGGTQLHADIRPGPESSFPSGMTAAGRKLYFSAYDAVSGGELWAMPLAASALSIADVRLTEGTGGTTSLRFTVTRTGSTAGIASVSYATSDATATAGTDYTADAGMLTFAHGESSRVIDIVIQGDAVTENGEAFLLVLSSPTGSALGRDQATGIIEDDDAVADLSVQVLKLDSQSVFFRVTNAGPATATDVILRASLSPGLGMNCGEPCSFPIFSLDAGESRDIAVPRRDGLPWVVTDPSRPPGYTVTVDVSAAEIDSQPVENLQSRILSADSRVNLPPFLQTGQAAQAGYSSSSATGASLSSSPSLVTVTPSSLSSPTKGLQGTFNLQAGATAGWTIMTVTDNWHGPATFGFAVVGPGETAKLDVGVTNAFTTSILGHPHVIPVTIAAQRHDGTRPTGIVKLFDASNTVVAQATLDATGSANLIRNGLPQGSVRHYLEYSGDAFFHPARVDLGFSRVDRIPTTTELALVRTSCQSVEGTVTVRTTSGPAPTGIVRLRYGGGNEFGTLSLTPTGVAGESRATVRLNLPDTATISITAMFEDNATFAQSSGWLYVDAVDCNAFATSLYLLTPCRVVDSRGGSPAAPLANRAVAFHGVCGIPFTAKAVVANVTAVAPGMTGWLTLRPGGMLPPSGTSTINYRSGKTRANNAILPLPLDGQVDVFNGATAPVHFIIDVTGYFQ